MEEVIKTEKPEQEETPVEGQAEPPQEKNPDEDLKAILEQAKADFENQGTRFYDRWIDSRQEHWRTKRNVRWQTKQNKR